jgi:glycosyltransferase involved in cell wall biosynthesis
MHAILISHAAVKAANRVPYRLLAGLGCEVTLVVPDRWRSGLGDIQAEPEPADSPLRMRVYKRLGKSHSNLYCLAGSLPALIRSGSRPAALYVDEDPAGFLAVQAAQAARSCGAGLVILAIQNLYKRYPAPFEMMQRYAFARAGASVSISEQAAETLRARGYAGPSIAMGFGTDVAPLTASDRTELRARLGLRGPLVGYVGRLVPEKGIDLFIEALALRPELFGVIAGGGPEREALEALARERGVSDRLTFTGILAPDDAARIIGTLDALVLPSRTRKNWAEQFGRVLIEAMASDVAVVASDSGAIREVVGDAGVLVREDDPSDLARGIANALDPETNVRLRSAGVRRVSEHFTNAAVARALLGALQSSLDSAQRASSGVPLVVS